VATSNKTFLGRISDDVTKAKELPTSIQLEIRRFVLLLTSCALVAALILIVGWGAWLNKSYPGFLTPINLIDNLIGLLVSFIPEGLPFCIALGLLIMAKKMAENKILVKNLSIIETLGCLNVLASDKTGTLTENKMTVRSFSVGSKEIAISNLNTQYIKEHDAINQFISATLICNNAKFEDDVMPISSRKAKGDATDISLLQFGTEYLGNIQDSYTVVKEIPFNSVNKWMMKTVAMEKSTDEHPSGELVMMMKGAPDIIISKCKFILKENGEKEALNLSNFQELMELQSKWASQARRVLLLASRICTSAESESIKKISSAREMEDKVRTTNDFCVVGLVGLVDPPREGIDEVVKMCRDAGIRVFMVTGDFQATALAVAKLTGILTNDYHDSLTEILDNPKQPNEGNVVIANGASRSLALNGDQLTKLSDDDWINVLKYDEIVFSRVSPQQKLQIVQNFQKDKNNVVGVTGDGVNDAPALKCANVGIAMGGGTDLAIESAQIVLLDNNFKSIHMAILLGRLIFHNLRKIMIYAQSAGEFSEIIPLFVNVFMGAPLPLSSFFMIVICVLTDVPAELSLVMEQPEANLIKLPPRNQKKSHLVTASLMFQSYFCIGILECISSHFLFFWYMQQYWGMKASWALFSYGNWGDGYMGFTNDQLVQMVNTGQSVYFVNLVIMQCFGNLFSTRTLTLSIFQHNPFFGKTRNLYCLLSIPISLGIMFFVLYLPSCNTVLGTSPVPFEFYFISLAFAMSIIVYDEIRKLLKRNKWLGFQYTI
jgi:sodium/potassium-transporting ATPase subunit alpha